MLFGEGDVPFVTETLFLQIFVEASKTIICVLLLLRWLILIFWTIFVSLAVILGVANDINISPVNILESSHIWVNPNSLGSIDTYDLNSVTRLHVINQILISTHVYRLWCLSFWDCLRCFLHLDVLFIGEHAEVVHHLICVSATTIWALFRLGNSASLNKSSLFLLAFGTSEVGFFHLGNGVRGSNDDTLQGDQLVYV